MKIQEISTEYGVLQYQTVEDHIMLTEYRGRDIKLTIPVNIDGLPVTIIGKKTFLAARQLKEIVLGEHISLIQDWAFASCRGLETITLPCNDIEIGQGVFKDCDSLCRIITAGTDQKVSYLLAAAMTKLDAFYLLDTKTAGSESWLEQWDARLISLMEQDDAEGFSKMLLCGEEDYGSRENNLDYYIEQKRRFKVRLAMLRLINDIRLKTDVKNKLIAYLMTHTKGADSEETWKVVLEEHGDDKLYYRLLLDTECINTDNIDAVLEDMGEHHTEMKAFLIDYQSANFNNDDIFASLEFEL